MSPPETPSTLQVTLRFVALPCTVAVNCWFCVFATTAALEGETLTVRVATVMSRMAVWINVPDVPVTLTVAAPVGAELSAVIVRILVDVAGFGLKDAVTPFGRPGADSVTALLNPFSGLTMTVLVLLPVCATVRGFGSTDNVKLGAACTVKLTAVL